MDLVADFGYMLTAMYDLYMRDIKFPEPIGWVSPFDITGFLAITYILAETISAVSSRRD